MGVTWTNLDAIGPNESVIFCPKGFHDFFLSQRLRDFLFVPRGCVIFVCPDRLHDFFSSPERFRIFCLSREVA